jgi:imidazolonepropionase-like amidohydrolase
MNGADAKGAQVLFTNVHVFDGVSEKRVENANVLVEDNLIKQISADTITADGATVIHGGGGTLMPGIIEAHGHLSLAAASVADLLTQLPDYIAIVTATQAEVMLMNGVTTARDMAGAVFGVKKAIDEGLIPGPRIYPSGPMICQTSGHLDFRFPNQANPSLGGPVPTSAAATRCLADQAGDRRRRVIAHRSD